MLSFETEPALHLLRATRIEFSGSRSDVSPYADFVGAVKVHSRNSGLCFGPLATVYFLVGFSGFFGTNLASSSEYEIPRFRRLCWPAMGSLADESTALGSEIDGAAKRFGPAAGNAGIGAREAKR